MDSPGARLYHVLTQTDSQVADLLVQFPEILGSAYPSINTKHGYQHSILTERRPVYSKPRRLDPEKLSAAKQTFDEMEEAGIISRSDSPWASPLHMVRKGDGS